MMWHGRTLEEGAAAVVGTTTALVGGAAMTLVFELVPANAMPALEVAWADLAVRALEPNLFFEPAFALPALATLYGTRLPRVALVWRVDASGAGRALAACLPLQVDRLRGFVRVALHPYAPVGTPLIDRTDAAAVLDCLLAGLRSRFPRAAGLILSELPTDGPVFSLLQGRAAAEGEPLQQLAAYTRAALRSVPAAEALPQGSPKRRKNLRRQRRRLGDLGPLAYRSISHPAAIGAAAERFLDLEARGWKGRGRTALRSSRAVAAFTTRMIAGLAAAGRCRIDSLEIDGRPVAMAVVLGSGDRAYFWKTTYDEAHAINSPGVQLALELTRTQLGRSGVALTDSCATGDHPMINAIWPDRIGIADVMVPFHGGGVAMRLERLVRPGRALAKRLIALRHRRHPE